jgi:hypothetical protein
MATKAKESVRRAPQATIVTTQKPRLAVVTPTAADGTAGSDVEPTMMMPSEIRAFGWNSQP